MGADEHIPRPVTGRGEAPVADALRRTATWNTPDAIARHRAMTPAERMKLAIEASRAALAFAHAPRVQR